MNADFSIIGRGLVSVVFFVFALAQERGQAREEIFELPLGSEKVAFFSQAGSVGGKGPLVISLHRNESTAFPIVGALLRENPGRFVGIKTPGDRRLNLKGGSNAFSIDPNRIFSAVGIERDLKKFSFYSPEMVGQIQSFASAYLAAVRMDRGTPVIAVHNNTDGGYSITSYRQGGSESAAAAEVSVTNDWDSDDFILVTNPAHFQALKNWRFNVVLQDNMRAPDDGSLSVYCGKAGIDYLNVEAEFGHAKQQEDMLRAAFALATGSGPTLAPVATPVPQGTGENGAPPFKKPGLRLFKPAGDR